MNDRKLTTANEVVWARNAVCAILSDVRTRNMLWFRAKIINITNDACLTYLLDFGINDSVKWDNLHKLPAEFASAPSFVECCALDHEDLHVVVMLGLSIQLITCDLRKKYTRYAITIVKKPKKFFGDLEVTLWALQIIKLTATTQEQAILLSINQNMFESGFCLKR